MATRTGRLVLDTKTGKVVDEMKEDQMMVALYDPACGTNIELLAFQRVLRSDFTVKKINLLFHCNAALLKDPFGNVLWPKDWIANVLPPTSKDKWYYVIHERFEPLPQDDLADPMYAGETILVLANVPVACDALDLRTWLLFGIAMDFAPLQTLRVAIAEAERKQLTVKQKVAALPSMDVDGDAAQQIAMRKQLADAIAGHAARFDAEVATLVARCKRIERLLMTEPMQLTPQAVDSLSTTSSNSGGSSDKAHVETRTWVVKFTSPRGQALATIAMAKIDWHYVCLVQTRPQPRAFVEDDQVANNVVSADDLAYEVNMRSVRLRRLKHGDGSFMVATSGSESVDAIASPPLPPWHDDFHISAIGAMYAGEWRLGERHGRGVEYTNAGFYDGAFVADARCGTGKLVLGDGTTCVGTFAPPLRTYGYASKRIGRVYEPSRLNSNAFRDGIADGNIMSVTFPDGAHYDGEMRDGRVTGVGRYTSSTGVVDEGTFVNGLLHGDRCSRQFPDGARLEGTFVQGELHGRGCAFARNGDSYNGSFDLGAKHGRGTSLFAGRRAMHVGFWHENAMSGRGDLYYRCDVQQQKPVGRDKSKGADSTSSNVHEPVPSLLDDDGERKGDGDAAPTSTQYDYWYEGSFVNNESVARHRLVDLHGTTPHHLPFTTNGKSVDRMLFVTKVLPLQLRKQHARAATNEQRRQQRERSFLAQRAQTHLALYYDMLDAFYDDWATDRRDAKRDEELSPDGRARVQAERAAMRAFEAARSQSRKERYDLVPQTLELRRFEECLERITLTEHTALERAVANDTVSIVLVLASVVQVCIYGLALLLLQRSESL